MNFRATLVHDHGSAKVMVVDISRDGLGMRPSPECAIGSRVSIDFEFGRSLRGTITRKDANGAGMIFASPLVFRL
ncbi:PilZ domain-containing protein [Acinetobacter baumannii]